MRNKKRYGCRPDTKDVRDLKFRDSQHFKLMKLPNSVDLTSKLPPCWDQGELGSCTGHGSVGAMVFIHPDKMFSRLDAYFNARVIEGDIDQDNGAQIRDVVMGLVKTGVCDESVWPYDISTFATPPALDTAVMTKVSQYLRCDNLDEVRNSLAQGFPVIIGFTVFSNFESAEMVKHGILHTPGWFDKNLGGHCVLVTGYDDTAQQVTIRNSWGTEWGPFQGNFRMGYDYFHHLVSDMWTIRA